MEIPNSLSEIWKLIFISNLFRYLTFAGIPFLIFYWLRKDTILAKKIQAKLPKNADYQREIAYSILTFVIFSFVGVMLYHPLVKPHTMAYNHVSDYGIPYMIFSFFIILVIHDTYFYWMHRAMHHPKLYKIFHTLHHKSTNPSPWASFAFQPSEAFFEAGIFVLVSFIMPTHIYTLISFLLFMTAYNVYGHLGWELYPKNFNKHWFGQWLNTSVNHNMHHQYFRGNYGLYFTYWDKLMGTTHEKYDERFAEITGR